MKHPCPWRNRVTVLFLSLLCCSVWLRAQQVRNDLGAPFLRVDQAKFFRSDAVGWTGRRVFCAVGLTVGLALAGFLWTLALRRKVNEQTNLIRARLERESVLEARYRDLFENAKDVVYTHDMAGNFTSVNRAAEL